MFGTKQSSPTSQKLPKNESLKDFTHLASSKLFPFVNDETRKYNASKFDTFAALAKELNDTSLLDIQDEFIEETYHHSGEYEHKHYTNKCKNKRKKLDKYNEFLVDSERTMRKNDKHITKTFTDDYGDSVMIGEYVQNKISSINAYKSA